MSFNQLKSVKLQSAVYLERKSWLGDGGSPKVDTISPFGSLDFCNQLGGVLVVVMCWA